MAAELAVLVDLAWADRVVDLVATRVREQDDDSFDVWGLDSGHCEDLARLAEGVLTTGRRLRGAARPGAIASAGILRSPAHRHDVVLDLAVRLADAAGDQLRGRAAPELVERGATRRADLIAARTAQVLGIALCVREGVVLTDCPCFCDLAGSERPDVLPQLIDGVLGEWGSLVIPWTG